MKKKWIFSTLAFLLFASYLVYTSIVRISKNFHEVDPGKFYRSAQLFAFELEDAIDTYGIKTVISLRGAPQNSYWFPPQVEVLQRRNVGFYDFGLSTDHFPSKDELVRILELLKTAPKPILIHCRSGSDRTGMISALYALTEMGQSKEQVMDQLRWKYWHVEALHPAMKEFIRVFQGPEWARTNYEPCNYPQFAYPSLNCARQATQ